VLKSLDVDDFLGGDDSDDSVFEMYKNLRSYFNNGGFNMRKWVSNSKVLQERIKDSDKQSPQVCQIQNKSVEDPKIQEEDQTIPFEAAKKPSTEKLKILGVGWDSQNDLFFLDLASPLETINNGTITKKVILGATSRLYDPLGLLSPVIILSDIIFQTICQSKVDWDDPVDSFLYE